MTVSLTMERGNMPHDSIKKYTELIVCSHNVDGEVLLSFSAHGWTTDNWYTFYSDGYYHDVFNTCSQWRIDEHGMLQYRHRGVSEFQEWGGSPYWRDSGRVHLTDLLVAAMLERELLV